jgi:hypothetical protein
MRHVKYIPSYSMNILVTELFHFRNYLRYFSYANTALHIYIFVLLKLLQKLGPFPAVNA